MIQLVQPRCIAIAVLLATFVPPALAQETPDAREILRSVRVAQSAQSRSVTGQLRTGARRTPFRLSMHDGAIRWEFQEPAQTFVLRLEDKSSALEEVTASSASKVTVRRLHEPVRDSDITFEDLAMRFLYWPDARIEGEQTIMLTKCWQIITTPPASEGSRYRRVRVWIAKDTGALMKAEAFGPDDRLLRTFTVRSGQKTSDGLWMLKQMRIETATARPGGDRTPTYIEIDRAD
jgi:hypothetical protein